MIAVNIYLRFSWAHLPIFLCAAGDLVVLEDVFGDAAEVHFEQILSLTGQFRIISGADCSATEVVNSLFLNMPRNTMLSN